MLTLGIDLASQPKNTAFAQIEWTEGSARILDVRLGAKDPVLLERARASSHVGIDARRVRHRRAARSL